VDADVYEGAPSPVTAFFAAAPKVAAISLFIRVLIGPFGDLLAQWQQVIWFISILSNAARLVRRDLANQLQAAAGLQLDRPYGYALIGIATGTEAGITGIVIYMSTYIVMSLGTFACVIALRRGGTAVDRIDDLAGLAQTRPGRGAWHSDLHVLDGRHSALAGFFGKLYVFLAAIDAQLYGLAVIGVLTSVVGPTIICAGSS